MHLEFRLRHLIDFLVMKEHHCEIVAQFHAN